MHQTPAGSPPPSLYEPPRRFSTLPWHAKASEVGETGRSFDFQVSEWIFHHHWISVLIYRQSILAPVALSVRIRSEPENNFELKFLRLSPFIFFRLKLK